LQFATDIPPINGSLSQSKTERTEIRSRNPLTQSFLGIALDRLPMVHSGRSQEAMNGTFVGCFRPWWRFPNPDLSVRAGVCLDDGTGQPLAKLELVLPTLNSAPDDVLPLAFLPLPRYPAMDGGQNNSIIEVRSSMVHGEQAQPQQTNTISSRKN
jgi:hypothetical protein